MLKRTAITRNVYKDTIKRAAIHEQRTNNYGQKPLLLHDNYRVVKEPIVQEVIYECGFKELQQSRIPNRFIEIIFSEYVYRNEFFFVILNKHTIHFLGLSLDCKDFK